MATPVIVNPPDIGKINMALDRIALAVEALAKAADPKFKTLHELKREQEQKSLPPQAR
ncbi:MAG: hypothetical protein ABSG25_06760 [Bryobacteraceae bacterium]